MSLQQANDGAPTVVYDVPSLISCDAHFCRVFLAQDVIYTSRAYATMSVSVCLSVCLRRKCTGALYLMQVSNSDPTLPRIAVAVHTGGRDGKDHRREEWKDHLALC